MSTADDPFHAHCGLFLWFLFKEHPRDVRHLLVLSF